MTVTTCPSCGLVTEHPHDTQEACIEALHREIARVRGILDLMKEPGAFREATSSNQPEEYDEQERTPGTPLDPARFKAKGAAPVF